MRPEIIAAVREGLAGAADPMLDDAKAAKVARAVLRAALTGQPEGDWMIARPAADGAVQVQYSGPTSERHPRSFVMFIATNADEALAVAHALNLSRDLAAGGNDGE